MSETEVTTYLVTVEHPKGEAPIVSVSEGARILSVTFAPDVS